MIEIVLPVPPSMNRMYERGKFGGLHLSQAAVDFKAAAYYEYINLVNKGRATMKAYSGDVDVRITVYRKRNSGDGDNFTKVLFDSLNGLAYVDDKQVQRYSVERLTDKDNPRLEMQIWDRWSEKPFVSHDRSGEEPKDA